MPETPLTRAARAHIRLLLDRIGPVAGVLDRAFLAWLKGSRRTTAEIRALGSITPGAASRLGSLTAFLEQVDYNGRRLAKLDTPPEVARAALDEFERLLENALGKSFGPAREQLFLATFLTLQNSYYRVREAEARIFFELYEAEGLSGGFDDLLNRFARILARAMRARAVRIVAGEGNRTRLRRPLFIPAGPPAEQLLGDPAWAGRYASFWSYPMAGNRVLQLAFTAPYPWLPRERALLEAAARRAREALRRQRLESEVRRLEAEARRAEEEERRRLGRELHDETGQALLFLRLQLEMMERETAGALRSRMRQAREACERSIVELRRIVAALSPAVLERLGLRAALRQFAARLRAGFPGSIRLRLVLPQSRLPRRVEETLYRAAQECLQNAARHSGGTNIILSLHAADRRIRLSVADNGAGFCAEEAKLKPTSFGLAGMRERAALMGGTLAIRTAPGKGARIVLDLPGLREGDKYVEDSGTFN